MGFQLSNYRSYSRMISLTGIRLLICGSLFGVSDASLLVKFLVFSSDDLKLSVDFVELR